MGTNFTASQELLDGLIDSDLLMRTIFLSGSLLRANRNVASLIREPTNEEEPDGLHLRDAAYVCTNSASVAPSENYLPIFPSGNASGPRRFW